MPKAGAAGIGPNLATRTEMRKTAMLSRTEPGMLNPFGQPSGGKIIRWTLPCRAWVINAGQKVGNGLYFETNILRLQVPLGSDVVAHDLVEVDGYKGDIEYVIVKASHLEITVESFGSI